MLTNKKDQPLKNLHFPHQAGAVFADLIHFSNFLTKKHYILFQKFDLTEAQFFTMTSLYYSKQKRLTFSEIGKILMVSRANVSGVISRLEARGFIKRSPSTNDKRLIYAALTAAGEKVVKSLRPYYRKLISKLFLKFSERDIKELGKLLRNFSWSDR